MTPEARAFLDQIDEFLSRNDESSAQVAAVLTALRSDDTRNEDKATATCPIRRAAFPKCVKKIRSLHIGDNMFMVFGNPHSGRFIHLQRRSFFENDSHYAAHARAAAKALDLEIYQTITT